MISDDTKAEAALVLSNCAANSREAAELTVSCQGAVEALKGLFQCQDVEAKRTAVGVFGNLSKCECAAAVLRGARVREDVLFPALKLGSVGVALHRELSEQELSMLSMRASAMMALTRSAPTALRPPCAARPPIAPACVPSSLLRPLRWAATVGVVSKLDVVSYVCTVPRVLLIKLAPRSPRPQGLSLCGGRRGDDC